MYKFDKEQYRLLHKLLEIRSHSQTKEEDVMINFLQSWIFDNIKSVSFEKDKFGNLYVTKGEAEIYPCFVAHVDINQDEIKDFSIIWNKDYIFGMDNTAMIQCGLGADDKLGCMLNLLALQKFDNIKCFFAKSEEVGAIGSKNADIQFFKDCSFLIQGDRNSYKRDISESTNGVITVSENFKKATKHINKKYGYAYQCCMFTDKLT
jgi:tripeptide aminopeptidase